MKLNLSHSEFLDFAVLLMYYTIKQEDFMTSNPKYNKLKEKMELRGMKSAFFEYFLKTSGESKKEFKRFTKILKDDSKQPGSIFIYPDFDLLVKEISEILTGETLNENEVKRLIDRLQERLNE